MFMIAFDITNTYCKPAVRPVCYQRRYCNLPLSQRNVLILVVFIVGVLAQFLWEAQAHKVSGRYIIGNC